MISQVVQERVTKLRETVGQIGLSYQFPKEFEYYMAALELCDSEMKTEYYFIFPVMPSSITNSIPVPTNTKITNGGITVIKNTQFVPRELTLTGNFGRSLKVLLGKGKYQELVSSFKDTSGGISKKSILSGAGNVFDQRTKTGYGCCKLLEEIVYQSSQLDDFGKQKHLIFYNLAFGDSFFVEPSNLTFTMSAESNMIWNYSLPLKAVARIDQYLSRAKDLKTSNEQLVLDGYFQKRTNGLVNDLTTFVNQTIDKVI
jgi:hypothetical protein